MRREDDLKLARPRRGVVRPQQLEQMSRKRITGVRRKIDQLERACSFRRRESRERLATAFVGVLGTVVGRANLEARIELHPGQIFHQGVAWPASDISDGNGVAST